MPIIRATAVIRKVSGVEKDAARNVWHFEAPDLAPATSIEAVEEFLIAFYRAYAPVMSPAFHNDGHRIDIASVNPGAEGEADDTVSTLIRSTSFNTASATTAGAGLPNELSPVMSFQGLMGVLPEESGTTRPRSRRRGRIYLPTPKATALTGVAPSFEPEFTVAFRETVLDAYDAGQTAAVAVSPTVSHVVYSRAAALAHQVAEVSIDNEPDVQRRRSRKATFRMQRSVTPFTNPGARGGADEPVIQ